MLTAIWIQPSGVQENSNVVGMQSCALANIPATPFVEVTYPSNLRSDLDVPTLILLSEFGLSDDGTAN